VKAILAGSSPGAMTAAILLMTRARQLGYPLRVDIMGEAKDITAVEGPAVTHAPVLASCGVGREHGAGGTVVVGGPADRPLLISTHPDGLDSWYTASRQGSGEHAATQAFYRLANDPRVEARKLAKDIRRVLALLGVLPSPFVLDTLFSAELPPLTRIAFTLRAGRAASNLPCQSITQFLSGKGLTAMEPFEAATPAPEEVISLLQSADVGSPLLAGLTESAGVRLGQWCRLAEVVSTADQGRDGDFIAQMASLLSHLVQLPSHSMLPPLDSTLDGVALCIPRGSVALDSEDANARLREVFQFLGGRYVTQGRNVHTVYAIPPPEDRLARWSWFCQAALEGRRRADELWSQITDPPC